MKKLYVWAVKDISYSKPYVQAAHAVAQFSLEHPALFKEWGNHTLIFLQCKSSDLEKIEYYLSADKYSFSRFKEPDYHDKHTATCSFIDDDCISKSLKKYRLL